MVTILKFTNNQLFNNNKGWCNSQRQSNEVQEKQDLLKLTDYPQPIRGQRI